MKTKRLTMNVIFLVLMFFLACDMEKPVYLTVKIEGQGLVIPSEGQYERDSIIDFYIEAEEGWIFGGWKEESMAKMMKKDGKWTCVIDEDKILTAIFVPNTYKLNVTIIGDGDVVMELTKNKNCEEGFENYLQLTAVPHEGWKFKEWRGDLEGSQTEIFIKEDFALTLVAVFIPNLDLSGTLSGNIEIEHIWPYPYVEIFSNTCKKDIAFQKIPAIEYAENMAENISKEKYVPGQLLVGFNDGLQEANDGLKILEKLGYKIIERVSGLNVYQIEIPVPTADFNIKKEIDALYEIFDEYNTNIEYIEPNYYLYPALANTSAKFPNDASFNRQWGHLQIRLPQAWSITTGSPDVRIAVLDSGIAMSHPDLSENIDFASGWNFTGEGHESDVGDRFGHGTICSGVLAANTNNNRGIAGVMWEATVIPVKVLTSQNSTTSAGIASALAYVTGPHDNFDGIVLDKKVDIISMSFGGDYNVTLQKACDRAAEAGILLFACAHNHNSVITSPAAYDSVICVGATDFNFPCAPRRACYSNYGPEMEIVAPGGDIFASTNPRSYLGYCDGFYVASVKGPHFNEELYSYRNGTSLSCPMVAGVAGLMLSNGIDPGDVREILQRTAIDLGSPGFDNEFGYGLVNAYWAVNAVEKINIKIGFRNGNKITSVAEGEYDLKCNNYKIDTVPIGEYKVFGWIDVDNNNVINAGDYYYESDYINFTGVNLKIDIKLEELLY